MSSVHSSYGASTSRPLNAASSAKSARFGSKGKGKERAVDDVGDEDDGDDDDGSHRGMSFSVRFTDGTTDDLVDLFVNTGESIREIKRRVS